MASQIYKLHGFVPNPCKIYYFMGSYCLHTNVIHYLNIKVVCMTFMCKNTNKHTIFVSKQCT